MLTLLFVLLFRTDTLSFSSDALDSIPTDTLQEVTVLPLRRLPIEDVLDESLQRYKHPSVPTVSDLLEKIKPGLNDIIMHPFAFKQRKRERRQRRMMKVLEEYGRVKTFNELLREAYEQQMREDSLMKRVK